MTNERLKTTTKRRACTTGSYIKYIALTQEARRLLKRYWFSSQIVAFDSVSSMTAMPNVSRETLGIAV